MQRYEKKKMTALLQNEADYVIFRSVQRKYPISETETETSVIFLACPFQMGFFTPKILNTNFLSIKKKLGGNAFTYFPFHHINNAY
jgi:hypothetical protein